MKAILLVAFLCLFSYGANASTHLNNVKIGDTLSSAKNYRLKVKEESQEGVYLYRQYLTPDGNDLSVTYKNGVVVFIEKDWSGESVSNKSGISNFLFGKTSLVEIRNRYRTNGFAYEKNAMFNNGESFIAFNCFNLTDKQSTVLALVTKIDDTDKVTESNISGLMKLEAIILANPQYLDLIWGEDKFLEDVPKKVTP